MRARRKRRRLFNLFAFALLAFAIYLVTFSNPLDLSQGKTVQLKNSPKSGSVATTR